MADDAKALIEVATRRFVGEVPALEPIKLVVGVELRGRGDVQHFRLEMPGVKVTKGPAADARVRVDMRREFFNVMAREAKVADWVEAFAYGQTRRDGLLYYRCGRRSKNRRPKFRLYDLYYLVAL